MKVIVVAGGTGGHIYPAISIIKKIQEMDKNSKIQTKEITTCKTLKEVEEVLNSNKEELFNQIDKMAKNPKPIRALKSMLRK